MWWLAKLIVTVFAIVSSFQMCLGAIPAQTLMDKPVDKAMSRIRFIEIGDSLLRVIQEQS
ncbi:hypothetical protein WM12_14910 [Burkholderia ubonensis]|nr:hypothetical protein WM12_14910 [Burkholderia ubonensis]